LLFYLSFEGFIDKILLSFKLICINFFNEYNIEKSDMLLLFKYNSFKLLSLDNGVNIEILLFERSKYDKFSKFFSFSIEFNLDINILL